MTDDGTRRHDRRRADMTGVAPIHVRPETQLEAVICGRGDGSSELHWPPQTKEGLPAGIATGRPRILVDVKKAAFLDVSGLDRVLIMCIWRTETLSAREGHGWRRPLSARANGEVKLR